MSWVPPRAYLDVLLPTGPYPTPLATFGIYRVEAVVAWAWGWEWEWEWEWEWGWEWGWGWGGLGGADYGDPQPPPGCVGSRVYGTWVVVDPAELCDNVGDLRDEFLRGDLLHVGGPGARHRSRNVLAELRFKRR